MIASASVHKVTHAHSIDPSADQLSAAIAAYRAAATDGEVCIYDMSGLDTIGMHACAALFLTKDGYVSDNFGYGATAAEAEVGALGELMEDLFLDRALMKTEVSFGSFKQMVTKHGQAQVIDPLTLCLPASSDYTSDQQMAWVKVSAVDGKGWALAPLETITYSKYQFQQMTRGRDIKPLFYPITSGLGAGTTREMALSHGILELLQRDGNCTEFRAMDQGVVIDPEGIADPGIQQLLRQLHTYGVRPIIKLASTEFGITNVYVVGGSNRVNFPLQQTACGEAAHPSATRAIRKALLEFAAARCRKTFMHGPLEPIIRITSPEFVDEMVKRVCPEAQEKRAMEEMNRWLDTDESTLRELMHERIFAEKRRVSFADLPANADASVDDPTDRLHDLTKRLGKENIPIYYFDASSEAHPSVSVTKAVIPYLECETMSYHRIGKRGVQRLLQRNSPLIKRMKAHEECKRIRLTAEAEQEISGPYWFDAKAAESIVGDLYPLYREPSSMALQSQRLQNRT